MTDATLTEQLNALLAAEKEANFFRQPEKLDAACGDAFRAGKLVVAEAAPERTTFTRIGEVIARARERLDKGQLGATLTQNTEYCLDLIDLLAQALPYVEEAEKDPAYKPGVVANLSARIRAAIEGER